MDPTQIITSAKDVPALSALFILAVFAMGLLWKALDILGRALDRKNRRPRE